MGTNYFPKEWIAQMKEECKYAIFLDEEYDDCIIGLDGMTGSVVYDIDLLSELEEINMNYREYDFRIGLNGGARFYEKYDALKFWKKRFADLDKMQKNGMLGDKFAPTYMVEESDESDEDPIDEPDEDVEDSSEE